VYHHVPKFFQQNKLPRYEVNIIDDWQAKLDTIVDETFNEDISILGGIPPWCIQYFEKLLSKSNKQTLKELYPNLAIYIHGGLDFCNYKEKTKKILGEGIHCLQTFPASEGFFAIQDELNADDMLLLLNQGIFYEFRLLNQDSADILTINEVSLHTRYELIITNNSGLYRYAIGDLVEFTSLSPYRIKVVGRTSQFISAFGEHVIAYEVETAMVNATKGLQIEIEDYYVSASIERRQYHWQIELKKTDINADKLAFQLDIELARLNIYYAHLINGNIINPCTIELVEKGFFYKKQLTMGKLGGQNKIVKLG
jgi:hypothetical protein